mmetsp:Transcript_26300/g.59732  ORF Transcript_26300/g.59732 Transcript_26300/m.59732 type:complete len:223 (-) Transcript_26300:2369-3037(-)
MIRSDAPDRSSANMRSSRSFSSRLSSTASKRSIRSASFICSSSKMPSKCSFCWRLSSSTSCMAKALELLAILDSRGKRSCELHILCSSSFMTPDDFMYADFVSSFNFIFCMLTFFLFRCPSDFPLLDFVFTSNPTCSITSSWALALSPPVSVPALFVVGCSVSSSPPPACSNISCSPSSLLLPPSSSSGASLPPLLSVAIPSGSYGRTTLIFFIGSPPPCFS